MNLRVSQALMIVSSDGKTDGSLSDSRESVTLVLVNN